MTDAIKHIDLDDEQFEDAPRALREYAAKLKKALEAAQGEAGQLRTQLATRSLSDVLGNKGFKNPKAVEKSLLADKVDPLDTSAVEAWLAENADDFAKADGAPAVSEPVQEQQQTPEQAAQAAAFGQMQAAQASLHQPADMSKLDLALSEITPDMNGEQVLAIYAKHGI